MAPAKETPQAFMPTSNDALQSFTSSNAAIDLRDESAILSPTQESDIGTLLFNLPSRDHVGSASDIPPIITGAVKPPHDEAHWYTLYNDLVEARRKDHEIWERERAGLRHEIDLLREQLCKLPAAVRHDPLQEDSSKPDMDKYTFSASMVNHATEKLRQFSVISPASTRRSSEEPNGSVDRGDGSRSRRSTRGSSAVQPMVTINETPPMPEKRVSLEGPVEVDVFDDPYSPAPTRNSPPPAEYTKYAGHTPIKPRSNRDSFKDEKHPDVKASLHAPSFLQPNGKTNGTSHIIPHPHIEHRPTQPPNEVTVRYSNDTNTDRIIDEDPELSGEKILPITPTGASKKGLNMLSELDAKLSEVAAKPDENVPVALHVANALDIQQRQNDAYGEHAIGSRDGTGEEFGTHNASNGNGNTNGHRPKDSDDMSSAGVPLRMKRSMNFGTQFGRF